MKAGKQIRREAKDLFRATVVNGIMDDTRVRAVVREVLAKKPRGFIAIVEHFKRLVNWNRIVERRAWKALWR